MDDLLNEFLAETAESIDVVDGELVKLEQDPDDKSVLDNIFRLVHTIKGTCGFLGLPRLEAVAHACENVLGKFRDSASEVVPEAVTLILESLDCIKEILGGLSATRAEPDGDDSALISRLNAIANSDAAKPATTARDPKAETQPANQTIRVNVGLLESLMNTVGELVLTRNQLMQILRAQNEAQNESEFAAPLQRLSQCTTELQEGILKTRMQPISNAWTKLPRIVRDLCMDLGKKIELDMAGADTELDRQVLELIKDPLTHMVRNSADHGIEDPGERAAKGKPETGTIRLNAYHQGGHIIIDITDDGAGLSSEKLKTKILENGLASEVELAEMTDQQIQKFIFHAGFSTAKTVTNVSGRGVGLDVVHSNIEKIGGAIDLKSTEGQGASFTIKIPLTLAIMPALIVKCGPERFAVPQINVVELVRISARSGHRIEHIDHTPVLRLRDRLLPLVKLADALKMVSGAEDADNFIIVTQVGAFTFGIIVDHVFDTEEIVVKPMATVLRTLDVYSGNTILGDGSVIMILDPNGIAAQAGDAMADSDNRVETAVRAQATDDDAEAMLLFSAGKGTRRAVPLSRVARLEEIDVTSIEDSGGKLVAQYRGQLIPLVQIDPATPIRESGRQPVLVVSGKDRSMGLAVDEIIDIVEDRLDVEPTPGQPGVLGTAVLAGKATGIIDVSYYVAQTFGDWPSSPGPRRALTAARGEAA